MPVEKPKPKQLLQPITTGTNSSMNQSQFLVITCNSLEAREKSRVHGAIGFGFASHWLKNWRESFKPITNCSNRNHVITFDSHLKTSLMVVSSMLVTSKSAFRSYKLTLLLKCVISTHISRQAVQTHPSVSASTIREMTLHSGLSTFHIWTATFPPI